MKRILSANLKRFRIAKQLTQEQAAERLNVSTQSISRWECGITLPDAMMLPLIAELYCVTIDDLYKETAVAYENYAQRLASVYDADRTPENYVRADREFQKLLSNGSASNEDLRLYGIIHQHMMNECIPKALACFDEVLKREPDVNDIKNVYWRTKHQKMLLFSQIGKSEDNIRTQLAVIQSGSDEPEEWICLVAAYQYAGQHEKAYEWFLKAVERYPAYPSLYIYGGDACKQLKRYEEAFRYWDKALALDDTYCDALYSKGFCYEELGEYEKAYQIWMRIAEDCRKDGYDLEVAYPLERAERCKENTQRGYA